jgi:hypothetical protein
VLAVDVALIVKAHDIKTFGKQSFSPSAEPAIEINGERLHRWNSC